MKKILVGITAVLLSTATLVGCGDGTNRNSNANTDSQEVVKVEKQDTKDVSEDGSDSVNASIDSAVDAKELGLFDNIEFVECETLDEALKSAKLDEYSIVFPETVSINGTEYTQKSYSYTGGVVRTVYSDNNGHDFLIERGSYEGIAIWGGLAYNYSWVDENLSSSVECYGNEDGKILAAEGAKDGLRVYVQLTSDDAEAYIPVEDLRVVFDAV